MVASIGNGDYSILFSVSIEYPEAPGSVILSAAKHLSPRREVEMFRCRDAHAANAGPPAHNLRVKGGAVKTHIATP